MSPRTGRPKSDEPRAHVIQFRLTDTEQDLLKQAAGPNLGPWCRTQTLAAARRALARARRRAEAEEQ